MLKLLFIFLRSEHHSDDNVYFFDLRKDGYTRTNRKKAKVNLRDTNDAKGHYQEVVDIILDKSKKTDYFKLNDNYYKGTIDPRNGNDWNYNKKIDTTPTENDLRKVIGDYLTWEISQVLKRNQPDFTVAPQQ